MWFNKPLCNLGSSANYLQCCAIQLRYFIKHSIVFTLSFVAPEQQQQVVGRKRRAYLWVYWGQEFWRPTQWRAGNYIICKVVNHSITLYLRKYFLAKWNLNRHCIHLDTWKWWLIAECFMKIIMVYDSTPYVCRDGPNKKIGSYIKSAHMTGLKCLH